MNHTANGNDELIDAQVRELVDSLQQALRLSQPAVAYQKCVILCSHLLSCSRAENHRGVKDASRLALAPWQERKAKELMSRHIGSTVRIADIAQQCSLSRSHFSRAFKQNTGLSPQQWLLQIRVERAMTLLANPTRTIAQVSQECGFADQSHFTRSFSRVVGETPCTWRRRQRSPELQQSLISQAAH